MYFYSLFCEVNQFALSEVRHQSDARSSLFSLIILLDLAFSLRINQHIAIFLFGRKNK